MLICAFAGREAVLGAYAEAVRERYRFYSYGDCMFAAEPLSDGKTISADELEATKKRVTDSLERLWKELKADANARASA